MARVVGIDAGTVSMDICVLEDGQPVLDRTMTTAEAIADAELLSDLLQYSSVAVLAAGYGLPLIATHEVTDEDLTLAYLPDATGGGIGGLRRLTRRLSQLPTAVWMIPGVIHLPSVPPHRKANRIDMGTADKVATVALMLATTGIDTTGIVLEMGGAFTAAIAVHDGRIVDGIGGSAGGIGARAGGALDAEVAILAGTFTKAMLFQGGAATIGGITGDADFARIALVEGAARMIRQLQVSVPTARTVYLTGRTTEAPHVADELAALLPDVTFVGVPALGGHAKAGAQGAAVLADAISGGRYGPVLERLDLESATGTVLDHLFVISPAAARARLGLS